MVQSNVLKGNAIDYNDCEATLRRIPRILSIYIILMVFGLFVTGAAAREILQGDQCLIDADTVIEGTLFTACETLNVQGTVDGDIIGGALRATISGQVTGSVYMLAGQMEVSGQIEGDLNFVGPVLRLTHPDIVDVDAGATEGRSKPENEHVPVMRGLKFASFSTMVGESVRVNSDVTGVGYQLLIMGSVYGEVNYWGSAFIVNGLVVGDVHASVGDPTSDSGQFESLLRVFSIDLQLSNPGLFMSADATIAGQLSYEGPAEGTIRGTTLHPPRYRNTLDPIPTLEEPGTLSVYFEQVVRESTTLLAVGLLALIFQPQSLMLPINIIRWRPFSSFSAGMLAFLLSFPIFLIMIGITLLVLIVLGLLNLDGIMVAAAVLFGLLDIGGATFFYFMAIFFSRTIIALAIGRFLYRVTTGNSARRRALYVAMLIGAIALGMMASLPFIGWLMNAVTLFLGLGALLTLLLDRISAMRGVPPDAPAWYPLSATASQPETASRPQSAAFFAPLADPTPVQDEPGQSEPRITVSPLPEGETGDQPPVKGPGLDNLPEGFDPDFFFNDDEDPNPDETG